MRVECFCACFTILSLRKETMSLRTSAALFITGVNAALLTEFPDRDSRNHESLFPPTANVDPANQPMTQDISPARDTAAETLQRSWRRKRAGKRLTELRKAAARFEFDPATLALARRPIRVPGWVTSDSTREASLAEILNARSTAREGTSPIWKFEFDKMKEEASNSDAIANDAISRASEAPAQAAEYLAAAETFGALAVLARDVSRMFTDPESVAESVANVDGLPSAGNELAVMADPLESEFATGAQSLADQPKQTEGAEDVAQSEQEAAADAAVKAAEAATEAATEQAKKAAEAPRAAEKASPSTTQTEDPDFARPSSLNAAVFAPSPAAAHVVFSGPVHFSGPATFGVSISAGHTSEVNHNTLHVAPSLNNSLVGVGTLRGK